MMKKLLLTFVFLMVASCYVSARTVYDSAGRNIIYDDTIRGKSRASQEKVQQQVEQQRKVQAAAAAKINYEEALKDLEQDSSKQQKSATKY